MKEQVHKARHNVSLGKIASQNSRNIQHEKPSPFYIKPNIASEHLNSLRETSVS